MTEPTIIGLYDGRGKRWSVRITFFMFLVFQAFCVWLSRDSTWWTFFTGGFLLLLIFSWISSMVKTSRTDFYSLDELQAWVDRQRAIESLL